MDSKKIEECFKQHPLLHTLFGVGLGVFAVTAVPYLAMYWLGAGIMGAALLADYFRKE